MKKTTPRKHKRVTRQLTEIATLSPIVAAARTSRMASTGDYASLTRMTTEKATTFTSAMIGMSFATIAAASKIAFAWSRPWTTKSVSKNADAWLNASSDIAARTLQPIRTRVVANSRRLGR